MDIKLYTTLGCHLCDEALEMLMLLKKTELELNIVNVEIADSKSLSELYGEKIPVVQFKREEIYWPFGVEELELLINMQK